MPEGCLERSTGWLPSKPPCSAISSFFVPHYPNNPSTKTQKIDFFFVLVPLFTPKNWVFFNLGMSFDD